MSNLDKPIPYGVSLSKAQVAKLNKLILAKAAKRGK